MAPLHYSRYVRLKDPALDGSWRADATATAVTLEAWGQGFMVGALIIMACGTVANMRKGVLLHKLILAELLLAIPHGTFCFMTFNGYGWYLSGTAALLYISCFVHNIVAWLKIKPFVFDGRFLFEEKHAKIVRWIYLGTLGLTIIPTVTQIVCNLLFFNNISSIYTRIRPTEFLFRDPWWLFSCVLLFHVIRKCYGTSVLALIARSPRLGILLAAICLSMIFTVMDILAVAVPKIGGPVDGINPYWKLTLIFKCLTDNILLDDFKTELRKIGFGNLGGETAQRLDVQSPYQQNRIDEEKVQENREQVESTSHTI